MHSVNLLVSLYADFQHTFLLIFFILLQLLRVFSDHRSSIGGRCCSRFLQWRTELRIDAKSFYVVIWTLKKHVSYILVKKILNQIDICILPYTSKVTVSGNISDISKFTSQLQIFDYMKHGKLIICSNLSVLREILKNNKNSILIKKFYIKNECFIR